MEDDPNVEPLVGSASADGARTRLVCRRARPADSCGPPSHSQPAVGRSAAADLEIETSVLVSLVVDPGPLPVPEKSVAAGASEVAAAGAGPAPATRGRSSGRSSPASAGRQKRARVSNAGPALGAHRRARHRRWRRRGATGQQELFAADVSGRRELDADIAGSVLATVALDARRSEFDALVARGRQPAVAPRRAPLPDRLRLPHRSGVRGRGPRTLPWRDPQPGRARTCSR